MQCDVCEESPRDREWVCPSCVGVQVQRRRAAALMSAHDKGRVEAKYVAHVQREQARADRINEREQRRWRLVQLQREVQHEQIAVQRVRSRVSSLRPFLLDQSRRVDAARAMLAQSVADYNITPEELRQHLAEQQAAAAAAAATASAAAASTAAIPSPSSSSIAGASSVPRPLSLSSPPATRRWQTNPAFTAKMRRYLEELDGKLAKYRLGLIRSLLDLYVLRRKSNRSCSIVGLELFDDPEEMFDAAPPPPPQEYPLQQQQQQQQQQPALNNNPKAAAVADHPGVMDAEVVAAGLGYIVLVLHMMSCYLSIRLPYPVRFHGSHSWVSSNDGAATRHYLTLLDNTEPNQFRRAITLLNHNIQYVCDVVGEGLAARQGKMQMARSGSDLHLSAHAHAHTGANAFKLAPLHLLPNMLILIETVTLALKQQMADPHAQQELRMQQARAMHHAKTLQRSQELQQQQQQQQKQLHLPPAYQTQQQHEQQRAHHSPDGALSPHLDGSISQSMVTVHRQDAFPPHHPSSTGAHRAQMAATRNNNTNNPMGAAATASTATNHAGAGVSLGSSGPALPSASPTLSRFDSPPFFSDRALKVASAVGHMSMVATPLSSPSHRGGFGSPSYGDGHGDGGAFGHRPDADASVDGPVHSDLLTPSTFFHLPPNGYMSTEEPRESVLLVRPQQQHQQQQQQQRTPNPSSRGAPSTPTHPSSQVFSFVSPSPGSQRSVLDVSHMPSPPPPFEAPRVAVSEVAAALGPNASHRALSSTSLAQLQHMQQHPVLSPAAMAAAPSFHPDIGDGAAAAAALDLPTAASQFSFLDPSHPLHPSHHQLGGQSRDNGGGVGIADALVRASSPRIASSPMHMQQQAVHAHQQQQQQLQHQQQRAHASPVLSSQHGAGSAPMRPPPHGLTPQQMQQQQRDLGLARRTAQTSMHPSGHVHPAAAPLRPSLSPSLPAVSYASEAEVDWDLVDVYDSDK